MRAIARAVSVNNRPSICGSVRSAYSPGVSPNQSRRGYAATDEELEEGISSVAAPVRITDGQGGRAVAVAVAAVSVVGPSQRLHRDGITTIAAHVQDAARRIGEALASG